MEDSPINGVINIILTPEDVLQFLRTGTVVKETESMKLSLYFPDKFDKFHEELQDLDSKIYQALIRERKKKIPYPEALKKEIEIFNRKYGQYFTMVDDRPKTIKISRTSSPSTSSKG